MQLFDYRCDDCGHRFEGWGTSDGETKPDCPSCESANTVKLISSLHIDYLNMAVPKSGSGDGTPTAVDRWANGREQKLKIEKRNMENHGTYD